MSQKHPMTLAGAEALREELHQLKQIERPKIVEAIATAREHGDLKENAEYHAAREQQSFNEGRILELEAKLSNVQLIDVKTLPKTGKVVFGVKVTILQLSTDTEMVFQIVGEDESDIKLNKLSYRAPLSRAMIGKEAGDVVVVQAPSGGVEYEILDVSYV